MLALFAGVADVLGEQAVGAYHWVTTKAMGCPSHDLGGVPVTSPVVCVSFVSGANWSLPQSRLLAGTKAGRES